MVLSFKKNQHPLGKTSIIVDRYFLEKASNHQLGEEMLLDSPYRPALQVTRLRARVTAPEKQRDEVLERLAEAEDLLNYKRNSPSGKWSPCKWVHAIHLEEEWRKYLCHSWFHVLLLSGFGQKWSSKTFSPHRHDFLKNRKGFGISPIKLTIPLFSQVKAKQLTKSHDVLPKNLRFFGLLKNLKNRV